MNAANSKSPLAIAVLISGGGTTLKNMIEKIDAGLLAVDIRLVVASTPKAGGLKFADEAGIPTEVFVRKSFPSQDEFSDNIFARCREAEVDMVAMGGFLKLVTIPEDFTNRVLNIHPALIPSFCGKQMYGHFVHEAVLEYGAKLSGVTVHFADNEYDHGPVIVQRAVPVLDDDTPETLAARVFRGGVRGLSRGVEPDRRGPGERLVRSVDRYRAQVNIRAEMVEVTLNEDDARGVDLSAILIGNDGDGGFNTAFSDGNDAATLNVHVFEGDFDISGVIAAINTTRESRLLSSPSITTLDNQAAKIHVGERVPYQRATIETQTGSTLAQVEFVDVGVLLEVTPTISENEMLYLAIHSEVSEVLEQSVQNVPRIGTREANTRVLVRAGDTVVIGGLMKDNHSTVVKKVPFLGDIPLLGRLFRRDTLKKEKTEFLVFIRPQLFKDPTEMRPSDRALEIRDQWRNPGDADR